MSAWNAIPAGQELGETRQDMIALHLALGEPCSCGCGQMLEHPELHHGILSKRKFQGVSAEHWDIRDAPCNLFLVSHACHARVPGPRHFWKLACERFGKANVETWYRSAAKAFKSSLENYD